MALAAETPRVLHAGNSTRGPFSLSVGGTPITFASSSHIVVTRFDDEGVGTVQVEGTDYDLSATSVLPPVGQETQTVTAATLTFKLTEDVLAADEFVLIERVSPNSQTQVLTTGGGFDSASNERTYDAIVRRIQELEARVDRSLILNDLDLLSNIKLNQTLDDLDGQYLKISDEEIIGAEATGGWSPVFAVVSDSARRVLQVSSWTGGEGDAPTSGVYVGASGFTATIGSAVDIRGATGASGNGSGDVVAANNGTEFTAATFATNLGLFKISNNLSEGNAATMRSNLGLGSAALLASSAVLQSANNLSDLPSAGTARTNLGLGSAATLAETSTTEYLANTPSKALSTDEVWAAGALISLTDAATIAVNMSTFINATVTLGGNRTLGQPSNTKVGQCGVIRIIQDGTGSRTLAYHADWKFAGGTDPTLSTAAGSIDLLFYQVIATNYIFASLVKAVA